MAQKFSLDSFKEALSTDVNLRENISAASDLIDFDNGSAIIHRQNINKYLERYLCKNEHELMDTLWYNYGVFVRIV